MLMLVLRRTKSAHYVMMRYGTLVRRLSCVRDEPRSHARAGGAGNEWMARVWVVGYFGFMRWRKFTGEGSCMALPP
jgi:hypothetical protein